MNVFEILVIQNPTPNQVDEGGTSEVVFGPEKFTAPTRDVALLMLGQKLPGDLLKRGHLLSIHCKSF